MCRRRLSISGERCTVFSSNDALPFVFVRALAARDQRGAITEAFISVVRDYNDYQEQLNNTDAKLNAFILNGFARLFASGEKTAKGYGDNPDVFVLPALKEAMQRIIAENTHSRRRFRRSARAGKSNRTLSGADGASERSDKKPVDQQKIPSEHGDSGYVPILFISNRCMKIYDICLRFIKIK